MLPSTTIVLVEQLSPLLPDEFSRTVLNGSLKVLWDDGNPIRANLFALGIREMVRHVLELKAPDGDVRNCKWFAEARAKKTRALSPKEMKRADIVTRRDRMIYATQGGLSDALLQGLGLDTEGMHDALVETIDRLSKYVHVAPTTILASPATVVETVEEVLNTVGDFFRTVEEFRQSVGEAIAEAVNDHALNTFLEETVSDLDELSTHTQVDDVEVEVVKVTEIGAAKVYLEASGTVYVELIYGSASDERRGDGARMSDSYPFAMTLTASTTDIKDLECVHYKVNTDSFYE